MTSDDEGAIRTRRPIELSFIDDISTSLASTLDRLSLSATASSTALHSTVSSSFQKFDCFTIKSNSMAANTRAPTSKAPGEENVPPESSCCVAHGKVMALDDGFTSTCESCEFSASRYESLESRKRPAELEISSSRPARPRCLKRETRRPPTLHLADGVHVLNTDTPMTKLVKTHHLRAGERKYISTPPAAPHGGVAARVDPPGTGRELGKRPLERLASAGSFKVVRRPHKVVPPRGSSPRRADVRWGRAAVVPSCTTPSGRLLAGGSRPGIVFPEDAFLR